MAPTDSKACAGLEAQDNRRKRKMEAALKVKDALIAFNPGTAEIKVGPLLGSGDQDWTTPYECTSGAAEINVRKLTGDAATRYILSEFVSLTVGWKVEPASAHHALLAIDEYREAVPEDLLL